MEIKNTAFAAWKIVLKRKIISSEKAIKNLDDMFDFLFGAFDVFASPCALFIVVFGPFGVINNDKHSRNPTYLKNAKLSLM